MATKLNNAQKGQLSDQLAEVYRVTSNGTRDFARVRKALQYIIEGNFPAERLELMDDPHWPYTPTSWYVSPEEQLRKVEALNYKEIWGFKATDIPWGVPTFTPRTETEVLMLNVCLDDIERVAWIQPDNRLPGFQRTFQALWSLIKIPGYTKRATTMMVSPSLAGAQQIPAYTWKPGISWVAFDPVAYRGFSPLRAIRQAQTDGVRVAGTEVLMAALLFPDWVSTWEGSVVPYPNLSGIQVHKTHYSVDGDYTPLLERHTAPPQLVLDASRDEGIGSQYCSPTIREL